MANITANFRLACVFARYWQNNSFIFSEVKDLYGLFFLAALLSFFASILEGIGIGLIVIFLQGLVGSQKAPINTGLEWMHKWILRENHSEVEVLLRLSILVFLVAALGSLLSYAYSICTGIIQSTALYRLRKRIFEQFQSFSLIYFSQIKSGELVNSIISEVETLWQPFQLFSGLLEKLIRCVVYSVILISISWQLSLSAIVALICLSIGLTLVRQEVRHLSHIRARDRAVFTSSIVEVVNAIEIVHAFATYDFERRRFNRVAKTIRKNFVRITIKSSLVNPITKTSGTAIILIILVYGFVKLQMPAELLLGFVFVLNRLVQVVQEVNGNFVLISQGQGSLTNIRELLRTDNKPFFRNGNHSFEGLKKGISLRSVYFGYRPEFQVLSNISIELYKGQTTALVGASGSGKTTLAALLLRFYDVQNGQILVDGVDIKQLDIVSFRQKVAIVSQDTFIFNTSVRDNIAYGLEAVSDREIYKAAHLANAFEFIQNLPEKLDTVLGDRGVKLSGGQRQRIAIARALLRDPEILILDEATSALDSEAEHLVKESIEQLSVGRTIISIAHRLSTIAQADQIIVLQEGRIIEQGSYQDLLEKKGQLWRFHQLQHNH